MSRSAGYWRRFFRYPLPRGSYEPWGLFRKPLPKGVSAYGTMEPVDCGAGWTAALLRRDPQ